MGHAAQTVKRRTLGVVERHLPGNRNGLTWRLAFVPAFLVAIGVGGSVFDFISPLPYPFSVVGPVVGIWYAIGIVYLIYLYARKPERVRDTARVFIEEEVVEASAPV